MKKTTSILVIAFAFICNAVFSQATLKPYRAGHEFNISIPDYMMRTVGLNDVAIFQYKNDVKDVYGFVIEDNKEELKIAELSYSSISEFYDEFIKDFVIDEPKRKVSKTILTTKGEINFLEVDVQYYDKDAETTICYLIGIVETKDAYYKVLSWSTEANKAKFKADFQKIVYSIND